MGSAFFDVESVEAGAADAVAATAAVSAAVAAAASSPDVATGNLELVRSRIRVKWHVIAKPYDYLATISFSLWLFCVLWSSFCALYPGLLQRIPVFKTKRNTGSHHAKPTF